MKFEQFAKAVGIDKKVMERRMKGSVAMGASAGPKPKLSKEKQQVVVDTMRRYDRANNGQSAAKAALLIQELNPKLTLQKPNQQHLSAAGEGAFTVITNFPQPLFSIFNIFF